MADAYRDNIYRCPTCGNAALRTFGKRLICDECGGMLLTAEDLTDALRAIDGSTSNLVLAPEAVTAKACPRCARELARAEGTYGKVKLRGELLACPDDDVWLRAEVMTDAFARVSRAAGPRAAHAMRQPVGGSGGGTMSSALAGISDAFGAKLHLGGRSKLARTASAFVSVFAGRRLACPECTGSALVLDGERWRCGGCAGVFVEAAALAKMVGEISGDLYEPAAPTGAPGVRECPACSAKMFSEEHSDRCAAHGRWFAADALGPFLQRAAEPVKRAGWLGRLLGR